MFRFPVKLVATCIVVVCSFETQAQDEIQKLDGLVVVGQLNDVKTQKGTLKAFSAFPRDHELTDDETASANIYIGLANLPPAVTARYRYAKDTGFHDVPGTGIPFPPDTAMVLIRLKRTDDQNAATDCAIRKPATDYADSCERYVIYSRDLLPKKGSHFAPAFVISADGLAVSTDLPEFSLNLANANYVVNRTSVSQMQKDSIEPILVGSSTKHFLIQRYAPSTACSLYLDVAFEYFDFDRPGPKPSNQMVDNGISVAPSKAFDNSTLREMLLSTSAQLASISGFNQASIIGALGNLQGVTRNTSYLSAQVTTLAPPSVSSTAVNGGSTNNTLASTLGVNDGSTMSTSVINCPPGTLPGVGTSGLPACAAVLGGTATVSSSGAGNNTGGASSTTSQQSSTSSAVSSASNLGQSTNQQNTVTTTNTGQAGVVAATPISTAFAAPTNLGLSASDMLAEQVQLNSEITTLRLLLQGALSDQYLNDEGRATGNRQQTTVGFGVFLDPPARYKHAVAEVRIWIGPSDDGDPVSVMNLLPAAKTYNVAKITSHQNAFGAGVAVEPLNVGVATGKSKDRLYLAKDTDTVAMQYLPPGASKQDDPGQLPRSAQEKVRDVYHQTAIWQRIVDACEDDPVVDAGTTVIGWQFRPVLGADYVQAGQRLVFAQLALPVGIGGQFEPRIFVQTRWREYDESRQVLGAVYKGSCSVQQDTGAITIVGPLLVKDVSVNDMGGGILKIKADGDFYSSDFSVIDASNSIIPTTFDGKSIQLFSNARNLLLAGDLQVIDKDGTPKPLARSQRFPDSCGISSVSMTATPRPDGNSLVEAVLTTGSSYSATDPDPNPLIVVGSQVYGLRETPFTDMSCDNADAGGVTCTVHFLAATDVLRTAQNFLLADLSWNNFRATGTIVFDPAFASLAILGTAKSGASKKTPQKAAPAATAPPLYTVSGFEFNALMDSNNWNCGTAGCLELYQGLSQFCLAKTNFKIVSNTNAVLSLNGATDQAACVKDRAEREADSAKMAASVRKAYVLKKMNEFAEQQKVNNSQYEYKSLRWIYHFSNDSAVEWDLTIPSQANPTVASSGVLNVGDSTQLVFSGVVLAGQPQSLMFESTVFATTTYKYDRTKQTLTVQIPTALTAKPGHKQLILTDSVLDSSGKANQILLSFDVTRR